MGRLLMLLPLIVLCGCLTTTKPVFTPETSTLSGETPGFVALVEAWEAYAGPEDSPREVIRDGYRVMALDGYFLIEEIKGDSSVEYYAVGLMGSRPLGCFAHDSGIEEFASRHGVSVTVMRRADDHQVGPAPMSADGSVEALRAFVLDVFESGAVACFSPPRKDG